MIILALYVDDGLVVATSEKIVLPVIEHLRRSFEVKVGEANYYLGFEIKHHQNGSIHIVNGHMSTKF